MIGFMEIAVGLMTLAVIGTAIAVVRALGKVSKALDVIVEPTGALSRLIEDAARTSTEVRELVMKLERISETLEGVAASFGKLGDRAVSMSSSVLDEVERPVKAAVSLVRGVRAGAAVLVDRWSSRRGGSDGTPFEMSNGDGDVHGEAHEDVSRRLLSE